MNTKHVFIAGLCATVGAGALATVLYLAFLFPKTLALWEDEARVLSAAERSLANASQLCTSLGLFLIPLLFLGTVGCVIWGMLAVRGKR